MQIAIKGRGIPVSDELRERVKKRFAKVDKQVSDLARLEVELRRERNPAIKDSEIAEVTLYLKGATLRACESARDLQSAVNLCAEDLARQVKRDRVKRRRRREARAAAAAVRPAL
ncbi:MAG TPA: ribosome-associated translation inhibitor RaiA [Capillimicrobium sp.]|jgi:putative sigma-54 modulation protein